MISSCAFTFGESSVWDPKVVREYLDIPEDQLNILRNLPEWSKSRHTDNASRIGKDTCENSQPCQLISDIALDRNETLISQNKILFEESCETQKSILEEHKLKSSKLFRSYSLFEVDKIGNSSFCRDRLRSTLSVPNLYLFPENLLPKPYSDLKNRDSSDRYIPLDIELPVYKESEKAYTTEQINKDTSDLEKNKYKICSETSNMEVDTQLPIIKPCILDQVKNKEANLEILVENKITSTNHTSNSPVKIDASNNQATLLSSPNKFNKNISVLDLQAVTSNTVDNNNICGKDVDTDIENMSNKNPNPEESEIGSKVGMKSVSPNPSGKNELILKSVEEAVHMDAAISKEKKVVEMNINSQVLTKEKEACDQDSESHGVSKELLTEPSLISPNEPAVKASCSSSVSKILTENDKKVIHKDVSNNKSFDETLSVKRKLESKNRSLKKRRKQSSHEERNLKKAGNINYSVEHIKTMLEIMKQFI